MVVFTGDGNINVVNAFSTKTSDIIMLVMAEGGSHEWHSFPTLYEALAVDCGTIYYTKLACNGGLQQFTRGYSQM